ncbi:MAG TPA: potassium-transporting ATPase subunit C [Kofleriaceae bacterium]|nr:potassium-transporting ATPase subunit C [Kofleriaceae bacterium]
MSHLKPALLVLAAFTLVCGVVYPLAIAGVAALFPDRVGELVGQPFTAPGYVWGRPTAIAYDATTSGATNLGPTNPALLEAVRQRVAALHAADPGASGPVPADLVTASASGLDPDISPEAAYFQAARVARVRHVSIGAVRDVIAMHIRGRTLGVLGAERVNVVDLNRALDARFGGSLDP